jgi:hypothetical protein
VTAVTYRGGRRRYDGTVLKPIKETVMKSNVGSIDRALRVVAGLVLLALVFVLDGDARWWGLIGVVPLATGLAGFCPLYALLGLTTCPMKHA